MPTSAKLSNLMGIQEYDVVIVGGGTAGISVAARLARALRGGSVAVVEPATVHCYQPLWTLVGGGVLPAARTRRPQASVIPRRVTWIREAAAELLPDRRRVRTASGQVLGYRALVVACGIELDWGAVDGLPDALGRDGVVSNYAGAGAGAEATWRALRELDGGEAVFTMPAPPIKCAGAPQKIAYLADDHFRRRGVRDRIRITYAAATPGIFAVPEYARALDRVIDRKGIETRYRHVLTAVRPRSREAVFRDEADGREVVLRYDLLHAVPPQRAPELVRSSPLADAGGWLEVDKETLRHPRHDDVFALGDASNLPTSKTGAAVRKQVPVVVDGVLRALGREGRGLRYDGYTSCPLVTGYGRLILAEFDYSGRPTPSFPFDTTRERRSMYELKRRGLPLLYWHGMLRGRA